MAKRQQGFALVELVTVLLIFGILAAMAIPAIHSFGRQSLRTAAQEMAARIREARQTAITSGVRCYVFFCKSSRRYCVVLPAGEEWVKEWVSLPADVSIHFTNFPALPASAAVSAGSHLAEFVGLPRVHFRFTGAPNRGGQVVLRDTSGKKRYLIVTLVTGRVRISETPPGE